ncbi:40S ribosomal protein, partial [Mortierella sp. AD032]
MDRLSWHQGLSLPFTHQREASRSGQPEIFLEQYPAPSKRLHRQELCRHHFTYSRQGTGHRRKQFFFPKQNSILTVSPYPSISWIQSTNSGISRDSRHKRSASGAKRAQYRKKRKFELGRQAANTKLGAKRIHEVRTRGGNRKFRALRLDAGNFSWGSEAISRKTRIVAVVYNSSNNELVRTGTLVKNAIIQIDATPFRQWYEAHYATPIGARKGKGAVKVESEEINKARSNH